MGFRDYYDEAAKERMQRGKKPPANLPEGKGDSRDAAGAAVGVSGKLDLQTRRESTKLQGLNNLRAVLHRPKTSMLELTILRSVPILPRVSLLKRQCNG